MHDNQLGTVSAIDVSYDGRYVITVGEFVITVAECVITVGVFIITVGEFVRHLLSK